MVREGKLLPKISEFPSRDPRRLLPALLAVSESLITSLPLRNASALAPNLRTAVSSNFVCVRACVRVSACVEVRIYACLLACVLVHAQRARTRVYLIHRHRHTHTCMHACMHTRTDTLSGETDTTVHRPSRAIWRNTTRPTTPQEKPTGTHTVLRNQR